MKSNIYNNNLEQSNCYQHKSQDYFTSFYDDKLTIFQHRETKQIDKLALLYGKNVTEERLYDLTETKVFMSTSQIRNLSTMRNTTDG